VHVKPQREHLEMLCTSYNKMSADCSQYCMHIHYNQEGLQSA